MHKVELKFVRSTFFSNRVTPAKMLHWETAHVTGARNCYCLVLLPCHTVPTLFINHFKLVAVDLRAVQQVNKRYKNKTKQIASSVYV